MKKKKMMKYLGCWVAVFVVAAFCIQNFQIFATAAPAEPVTYQLDRVEGKPDLEGAAITDKTTLNVGNILDIPIGVTMEDGMGSKATACDIKYTDEWGGVNETVRFTLNEPKPLDGYNGDKAFKLMERTGGRTQWYIESATVSGGTYPIEITLRNIVQTLEVPFKWGLNDFRELPNRSPDGVVTAWKESTTTTTYPVLEGALGIKYVQDGSVTESFKLEAEVDSQPIQAGGE